MTFEMSPMLHFSVSRLFKYGFKFSVLKTHVQFHNVARKKYSAPARWYVCISDWNATDYTNFGEVPIPSEDYKLILPMVLQVG